MLTWKVHARLPPGLAGSLFSGESDGDAEEVATAAAEVVAAAAAFSTEKLSIPGAERFLLLRENETNMVVVVWWWSSGEEVERRWERSEVREGESDEENESRTQQSQALSHFHRCYRRRNHRCRAWRAGHVGKRERRTHTHSKHTCSALSIHANAGSERQQRMAGK